MKYVILLSCLLAACQSTLTPNSPTRGGLHGLLSSQNDSCATIEGELKPSGPMFDIEVDIEDVSQDGNFVFYTVCHSGKTLASFFTGTPLASGPGTIEYQDPNTATVYVRMTPELKFDFKDWGAGAAASVDLIDAKNHQPLPGDWPACNTKNIKKITIAAQPGPPSTPEIHYISFNLCALLGPGPNYYTYLITLTNGATNKDYILDPQIIHHPSMAAATP